MSPLVFSGLTCVEASSETKLCKLGATSLDWVSTSLLESVSDSVTWLFSLAASLEEGSGIVGFLVCFLALSLGHRSVLIFLFVRGNLILGLFVLIDKRCSMLATGMRRIMICGRMDEVTQLETLG